MALREAHEERRVVNERITAIVAAAREYGISWQRIGHAIEMSKQAAWERFGSLDKRASAPNLSFTAARGQLASWRGRRVRILVQSPHEGVTDFERHGRLEYAGYGGSEMITCWVGQRRGNNSFTLDPDSFREARIGVSGTLIVELTCGQVEVAPVDPGAVS
jgi:hypothetical protein